MGTRYTLNEIMSATVAAMRYDLQYINTRIYNLKLFIRTAIFEKKQKQKSLSSHIISST